VAAGEPGTSEPVPGALVAVGSGGAAPAGDVAGAGAVVAVPAPIVAAPGAVPVTGTVDARLDAQLEGGAVAARTPTIPSIPATLNPADTTRLPAAGCRRALPPRPGTRPTRFHHSIPAWIGIRAHPP
jgi:hypothetical protein